MWTEFHVVMKTIEGFHREPLDFGAPWVEARARHKGFIDRTGQMVHQAGSKLQPRKRVRRTTF